MKIYLYEYVSNIAYIAKVPKAILKMIINSNHVSVHKQ